MRIEQENAVVLHAVDQQPEPLLAFLERILVALLLAQVLDDLGETQQRSGAVAQGGDHHAGPEGAAILAQPQRAALEVIGRGCHLQFVLRPTFVAGGLGVEPGDVLA